MNTSVFAARLHAAHLPAAGVPVSAHFSGEMLVIDGSERARIAASALTVTAGGFAHDQLFLGWTAGNGQRYSLQPVDDGARAQLLDMAPASLSMALQRWRGGQRRRQSVWLGVGAIAITLLFAGVVIGWQADWIIDGIANRVPVEAESVLGEAAMTTLRQRSRVIENGPAVDALRRIGDRLTQGSRYRYHWAIEDDPTINAFAMPGGWIVVHRGLIEAAPSAEALAGVLAHEVQHVERRHVLKGVIHSLGWAGVLSVMLGDVGAASGALVYQAGQLRYSRALETEADRLGVIAMAAAGIDPAGMLAFFRAMIARSADPSAEAIGLLSSHPATRERLAAIEADIAALPAQDYPALAIDWPALQMAVRRDR